MVFRTAAFIVFKAILQGARLDGLRGSDGYVKRKIESIRFPHSLIRDLLTCSHM